MIRAGRGAAGRSWLVAAAAAVALAGCTSVPHAAPERDAEVKQFLDHPNAATLYVYRPDFAARRADESVLYVDGRLIGATLPGTFFRIDLRAGPHLLHGYGYDQGRLKVETRNGEIVFVSLNVMGGTSLFERVAPGDGRRAVVDCCVLLENWTPGQRPLLR
ncbi:MAG: hypothetical protein A3I02_14595 [Betaproteobacteria bacterium RIFCSPLOWO2_02_FULL_67_26]|nr:MAG: hypothetical protein A3I02_14595 [Betaproteobacteria bacterium RIFCSPLOWO2_02_FULL_67_26]